MRAGLSALAFLFVATAAHAATDDELRQKIVGTWGKSAACAKGQLAFTVDGNFSSRDADGTSKLEGTYDITDGMLNGKVGGDAMPEMAVSFDTETLVLLAMGSSDPDRLTRCAAQ